MGQLAILLDQFILCVNVLGLCSNTCFTCGGKGVLSGTLVIRTQTLTWTCDWWLVIAD